MSADWRYRGDFLAQLVRQVPDILRSQDPKTGRFGTGIWVVNDQHVIFPLAAAWGIDDPANPYHHSPEVLQAVIRGGDALIADQDSRGMWVFRKKDGSTWGDIYMPWTYSRWIRAFALIRDAMPPESRTRWEKALTLGYEGISKNELKKIHNIPAHHAMGLWCAGAALGRPEWQRQAADLLRRVAASQDSAGFWSENSGPVVGYNFVYTDALGVYYGQSKDRAVLTALERAARFHAALTYPDGSSVETVDERQVYHPGATMPNVGFSWTPEGRGYLQRQWEAVKAARGGTEKAIVPAELAASFLLYGTEGPASPPPGDGHSIIGKGDALVERRGPWTVALSAYTAPVPQNRWIQDRQNLVSLFHTQLGLILGGGNTKLQPLWSTFTVGDTALLFHKPGDENPDFTPPAGLFHVPTRAKLEGNALVLALEYGPASCRVQVAPDGPTAARLIYSADTARAGGMPVAGHVPFMPHIGKEWKTASGRSGKLGAAPLRLTADETGGWFEHAGWRVSLPAGTSLIWPVLPHDQYKKDGSAAPNQGRLVVVLPLTPDRPRQEVTVSIL